MKGRFLIVFFVIFATTITHAQGTIRGTVKDKETQEPVAFASVKLKVNGETRGAKTDFDGEYQLNVPKGTYEVTISATNEGYVDKVETITVDDGEIKILNAELSKTDEIKAQEVAGVEVVYTKTKIAETVEEGFKMRDKEPGPTDIMTASEMSERGVRTVVEAAQATPGVTIEDGKNVYVRGLGDRYTKTILNGMEIPGLDPDRNSVQLDIFPAAVVSNLTIYKTFLPNWTGDYTGGLVNITTKDLPQERYIYAKAGLGYNNLATFNSDYRTYEGGGLDFLGFDDGTRALPISKFADLKNPVLGDPSLEAQTRAFNPTMGSKLQSQFMNQNYAFAFGDRVVFNQNDTSKQRVTYGYNIVANYRNSHQFYEDVEFGEYRLESTNGVPQDELEKSRVARGEQSQHNVLWTALIGQSVKWGRSKIDLALFRTQNGMSNTAFIQEEDYEDNPGKLERTSLEYTQRSVSNANLAGRHTLDSDNKWVLEWKLSPTYSSIQDPDIRSTALAYETDSLGNPTTYSFDPAIGAQTRRIWRSLTEYNLGGRFDFEYKWKMDSTRKADIKFGGLNTYRERNFEILQYLFEYRNGNNVEFSNDPDWYFLDENIWTPESDQGMWVNGNFEPANNFNARQNVVGAYVMNMLPITEKLEVTYGARVENAKNWYTGQNNFGDQRISDSLILDNWNLLPSVNAAYKIEHKKDATRMYDTKTNFRFAYTQTLARPSFKEKSLAQIFDPLQGRTFNGNIDLQQTTIHNIDARWEHFFGRTELISLSGFYKKFNNPIELIAFNTAPDNVQPLNTGTADVFGGEVEVRKAIGFNKESKRHLSFVVGGNFTYVVSRVDMRESRIPIGAEFLVEKQVRQDNARVGEVIGNYRQMYGQSPYIINAFTTFRNDSLGLIVNVNYNVQGPKLAVIGTGRIPDVYEQPFHSLNLKVSKTFGSENQWQGSLTGRNLLMDRRERLYESFNATPQVYSAWSPGFTISASVTYNITGKKKKKQLPEESSNSEM